MAKAGDLASRVRLWRCNSSDHTEAFDHGDPALDTFGRQLFNLFSGIFHRGMGPDKFPVALSARSIPVSDCHC